MWKKPNEILPKEIYVLRNTKNTSISLLRAGVTRKLIIELLMRIGLASGLGYLRDPLTNRKLRDEQGVFRYSLNEKAGRYDTNKRDVEIVALSKFTYQQDIFFGETKIPFGEFLLLVYPSYVHVPFRIRNIGRNLYVCFGAVNDGELTSLSKVNLEDKKREYYLFELSDMLPYIQGRMVFGLAPIITSREKIYNLDIRDVIEYNGRVLYLTSNFVADLSADKRREIEISRLEKKIYLSPNPLIVFKDKQGVEFVELKDGIAIRTKQGEKQKLEKITEKKGNMYLEEIIELFDYSTNTRIYQTLEGEFLGKKEEKNEKGELVKSCLYLGGEPITEKRRFGFFKIGREKLEEIVDYLPLEEDDKKLSLLVAVQNPPPYYGLIDNSIIGGYGSIYYAEINKKRRQITYKQEVMRLPRDLVMICK